MSKSIDIALQSHKDGVTKTMCRLLKISGTRSNTVYGFAGLDQDVTYDDGDGEVIYRARTGIDESAFVTSADLRVDNAEVRTLFGSEGLPGLTRELIELGEFDGADAVLYQVNWKDLAAGHEVMQGGKVGRQTIESGSVVLVEIRSQSQVAKQSVVELTSTTCRCRQFGSQPGDERFPCGYDITGEWVTFTVSAVDDDPKRQFNASALTQAQDYFAPGVAECITGANAGRQVEVEAFGPTPTRYHALLHFEGTNGSTTFTDDTGRSWTASGNAQISTTSPAIGTGCLLLDGSLDYISTADSADFQFGAGAFTVQCFVRFAGTPTNAALIGKWGGTSGARSWVLYLNAGTLFMRFSDSGGTLRDCSVPWAPAANTTYHVAASRDAAGVVRLFIDGAVVATANLPQTLNAGTNGVRIGHAHDLTSAYYVNGRMDEVAITKGLALYTAAFTPPAAPLALRTGGDVTLLFGLPQPMAVGDQWRIRRDCTREWTGHNSCETYHGTSKGLHHRGEPHLQPGDPVQVPGAEI